jgi:3-oxoacyl-[acyl-carrier protein] reductase
MPVRAIELVLDDSMIEAFATATGDQNPLHVDDAFARKTRYRGRIAHGMLPVVQFLGGVVFADARPGRFLSALKCRFEQPVRPGDGLRLEGEPVTSADDQSETWKFTIRLSKDQSIVTIGEAIVSLGQAATADSLSGPQAQNATSIPVSYRTLKEIEVGLSDGFGATVDPRAFDGLLGGDHTMNIDPNCAAAAMSSPLVGMRLPGAYATFLELSLAFRRPLRQCSFVNLTANVSRILPAGGRITINMALTEDGQDVGDGIVSALVGSPAPHSISCETISQMHTDPGLRDRVALVIGASRGIGEATSKMLAMSGAKVAVHYFRGASDAKSIVDEITEHGGTACEVGADLADADQIDAMFSFVEGKLGPVDVLVNNSVGEFSPKKFENVSTDDLLAELEISVFGMHRCCQRALPNMRSNRWGRIIGIGTVATHVPVASQTKYITAKSGLVGYLRSLAVETADDGVNVNIVVPEMTETSLIASLPRGIIDRLAEDAPRGSLLQPIEVAKVVAFLSSRWADPISGQQILLTRGAAPFV